MHRVLQDNMRNGKSRSWGYKKSQSRKYAERLYSISANEPNSFLSGRFKRKADRVFGCGDTLVFGRRLFDHKKVLVKTWFCRDKLCAMCQWRRMLKMSYQMTKTVEKSIYENPSSRFIFITLTAKNVIGEDLNEMIKKLNSSVRKLLMYKEVKRDLLGFVKAVEVTVNRETLEYHPHIHLLVQVKSTYFKEGHYLSQDKWCDLWKKALQVNYDPMVNIKIVRPRGQKDSIKASVSEIAKYSTKSTQYLSKSNEQDMKIIKTLTYQLKGLRMIAYGGILKNIYHDLFKSDNPDDIDKDLLHVGTDKDEIDKTAGQIVARFNTQIQNYVIAENDEILNFGNNGGYK